MHQPLECSICYHSCPLPSQTWPRAPPPLPDIIGSPRAQEKSKQACVTHIAPAATRRSSLAQPEPLAPWDGAVASSTSEPSQISSPLSFSRPDIYLKSTFSTKFSTIIPGRENAPPSGHPRRFLTFISDFPNCSPRIWVHGILLPLCKRLWVVTDL